MAFEDFPGGAVVEIVLPLPRAQVQFLDGELGIWTVAHQAPLPMGFSRQEYWSRLPCPPPEVLHYPGTEPTSLMSPTLSGGFSTTSTT